MIVPSLVVAVLLVAAAHIAARAHWKTADAVAEVVAFVAVPTGLVGLCMGVCSGILHIWLFILVFFLFAAFGAWSVSPAWVRRFAPFSLAAVLLSGGCIGQSVWSRYDEVESLTAQSPFESLVERTPNPRERSRPVGPAAERLERLDRVVSEWSYEPHPMQRVHEVTVAQFVKSPGFGTARGIPYPRHWLDDRLRRRQFPPREKVVQPGAPALQWGTSDGYEVESFGRAVFDDLHFASVVDFVNPDDWGYFRSRREVSGFLPHAFSHVPYSHPWRIESIQLLGLLMHPRPIAYVTEHLPAMADAVTAPTRPLDHFEATALDAIRAGDDGFAGRRGDEVRFVGAVRSVVACVACHGGERGDLLGAFSYRLRPTRE